MRRLAIILWLAAAVAAPLVGQAEPTPQTYRIGILSPELPPLGLIEVLRSELRALGYGEEKVVLELRNAGDEIGRLAQLADELVRLKVDVIVTVAAPAAQAAKAATATMPIVMTRTSDPVKTGLVPSFSRPGGNLTGISPVGDAVTAKRVELLKEVLPGITRAAVLWDARNIGTTSVADAMEPASARFGIELFRLPFRRPDDLPGLFRSATSDGVQAIIVVVDNVMERHKVEVLDLASKHRIPVISLFKEYALAGGPFAFGPDSAALYRRVAQYVDRILKGARPSDLPTRFELVVNLKAARELGIEIPASLLARADEVIE